MKDKLTTALGVTYLLIGALISIVYAGSIIYYAIQHNTNASFVVLYIICFPLLMFAPMACWASPLMDTYPQTIVANLFGGFWFSVISSVALQSFDFGWFVGNTLVIAVAGSIFFGLVRLLIAGIDKKNLNKDRVLQKQEQVITRLPPSEPVNPIVYIISIIIPILLILLYLRELVLFVGVAITAFACILFVEFRKRP